MSVKEILRLGHPVLRQKCQEVNSEFFQSEEFKSLVNDLRDSMDSAGGIGIAAPQIGVSKSICLVKIDANNARYKEAVSNHNDDLGEVLFINPQITILDQSPIGIWEGCLSVPGLRGFVERANKIKVSYKDIHFKQCELELEGLLSIVIQHELDHLEGILYVDKVKSIDNQKMFAFVEEYTQFILPKT